MKIPTRLFALVSLALSAVSLSFAGPGLQHWQTLKHEADFKSLKPGDRIAVVCNMCKTVTEQTVESMDKAMAFCKEGATVQCPACKGETKVTMKGPPRNPSIQQEVTYINHNGEECMFITKVASN